MSESQSIGSAAQLCAQCAQPLDDATALSFGCVHCLLGDVENAAGSPTGNGQPARESEGAAPESTRTFQHYEILLREDGSLWELGRGAMGVTHQALDINLRTAVALKVIHPRSSAQPEAQARFLREARVAARLRHPNVASVFHCGTIMTAPAQLPPAGLLEEENERRRPASTRWN